MIHACLFHKVRCAFCDTEYPSSAIGSHLTSCGNKTEQCPNCEKFVRRAVFAYHYENSCAADPDISTPQNEKRKFHSYLYFLVKIFRFIKAIMISIVCQYCNQHCFKPDYKTHRVYDEINQRINLFL